MGDVIRMPHRQQSEAVSVLEEMLSLARTNEPVSMVVIIQFTSGSHHVGATGRYIEDDKAMSEALNKLNSYLEWGRAYLEPH
jgi:hypothetical protein